VCSRVHRDRGRTVAVDFVNVPSYVLAHDVALTTSRGAVVVTVSYGGAIYAGVDATSVGLTVDPTHHRDLIGLGREIKRALDGSEHAVHPSDPRLSGVYGTIVYQDLGCRDGQVYQRNVTVFADGEVDRSPCGPGPAPGWPCLPGRAVWRRRVRPCATSRSWERCSPGPSWPPPPPPPAARLSSRRSGMAYRTGEHTVVVDSTDPLVPGFVLR
jgi:proline racemase